MATNSKLTLIIDGNWLLMSRLTVMKDRYSSDKKLVEELKILMCKSIKIMLRTFPKIDNIIMVADGGSWRCDLDMPKFLDDENITYKGNREQDPNYNWDMIFEGYGDFLELMNKSGVTTCREFGVEGDDWCWNLSRRLNAQGTNVIIWSMDKDLTQLVQTDKDGVFTVTWNKLYMTMEDIDENEMDFLFNYNYSINESLLNHVKSKAKDVHRIRPTDIVIDKIIRGDAGDNILPIILKESKSSDKKFRVGVKDIDFELDIFDDNAIDEYLLNLLSSKSYKDKVKKPYQNIFEHFKYNTKLVMLHESSYPEEILEIMNNTIIGPSCTNISYVEQQLNADKYSGGNIDIFDEI